MPHNDLQTQWQTTTHLDFSFNMSRIIDERSPRTLLDAANGLRDALYDNNSAQMFSTSEIVIDKSGGESKPLQPRVSSGTGFILREVELVLLDIRKDLDIDVNDNDTITQQPLMLRIRAHADEISSMLTGNSMGHPNDGSTTISQLILDLNRLRASVENHQRTACVIS